MLHSQHYCFIAPHCIILHGITYAPIVAPNFWQNKTHVGGIAYSAENMAATKCHLEALDSQQTLLYALHDVRLY